jgi:hypothetical protein
MLMLFSSLALAAKDDKEYYTQHNIWLFKNQTSSDNYAVEALVPVNSKVKIVKENDKVLKLKTGENEFEAVLMRKHSKKTMAEFKSELLKETPVDLSKFSKSGQDAIRTGQIKSGMTKQEVLVSRGYPPDHATLSLDTDTWKYWQNKWNTILVHFENNKVTDIKD